VVTPTWEAHCKAARVRAALCLDQKVMISPYGWFQFPKGGESFRTLQLANGATRDSVVIGFAYSDEFFNKATI
jgi:hypothetical protein